MEQEDDGYVEADMVEAGFQYEEATQVGQGPYYTSPGDPNLANLLDDHMASVNLQSAVGTPVAGASKGKKKHGVAFADSGSEAASEDDNSSEPENERDEDFEPEEEEEHFFTPTSKPLGSATRGVLKSSSSKTPKNTPSKSSSALRRTPRKSAGKGKNAVPVHRKRRAPKNGISESRVIPRSYEECDNADKALLDMRDVERKTWKEIRNAWEGVTGHKTGASTLPNRYDRLKDNFSVIKEEDRPRLLEAKDEVEREMNRKKWVLIAEKVQMAGGDRYTPDQLQRQWKKLMIREGLRPPPGIVDADFGVAVSDDEWDD